MTSKAESQGEMSSASRVHIEPNSEQSQEHTDTEFVRLARKMRPFYFVVVLWGAQFRDYFLNFCLPSLLSPNNIPALLNQGVNKFLIATTPKDWAALESSPIFERLKMYVEPVFLEIPLPKPGATGCEHMGVGHKLASTMAHQDKAYGIYTTPDFMISDGSIAALQRHAVAGKVVVLSAALRFGEEPLFDHLKAMGIVSLDSRLGDEGKPLTITGRQFVEAGIKSFHSEAMRYEWDAPYFTRTPCHCWWKVPGENGIVIHSLSWATQLVDYSAIEQHDTHTLDNWTIDGDYIHRNYGCHDRIYIVQDSDEIIQVSWAPLDDRPQSLKPHWVKGIPVVGEWFKGAELRDYFLSPVYDPLKRNLFALPIRWHSRELNQHWPVVEQKAMKTLRRYLMDTDFGFPLKAWVNGENIQDRDAPDWRVSMVQLGTGSLLGLYRNLVRLLHMYGVVVRVVLSCIDLLSHWRRLLHVTAQALCGDRYALWRIRRRAGKFWDQLCGRPFVGD